MSATSWTALRHEPATLAFYRHVPQLPEGARGAATMFAAEEVGDVHLTWENEAIREVAEARGKLEIVYPPVSILAEPCVAWVDANVARDGMGEAAQAYLRFLYSDEAQQTIARIGYRPYKKDVAPTVGEPQSITLFPITAIARDWDDAQERFFADNGIVDAIMAGRPQ